MKDRKSGFNPKAGQRVPGRGLGVPEGKQGRENPVQWTVGQPIPQGKKGGKK